MWASALCDNVSCKLHTCAARGRSASIPLGHHCYNKTPSHSINVQGQGLRFYLTKFFDWQWVRKYQNCKVGTILVISGGSFIYATLQIWNSDPSVLYAARFTRVDISFFFQNQPLICEKIHKSTIQFKRFSSHHKTSRNCFVKEANKHQILTYCLLNRCWPQTSSIFKREI